MKVRCIRAFLKIDLSSPAALPTAKLFNLKSLDRTLFYVG